MIQRSLVVVGVVVGLAGLTACKSAPEDSPAAPSTVVEKRNKVTSLGRLEPGLGVVDVGLPSGDRVSRLLVSEGEEVSIGQPLAVLESYAVRQGELEIRQAQVGEARQRLDRSVQLQPLAIESRRAEMRRLEADLRLAESDLGRTQALVHDDVLPERELDYQEAVEAQAREALEAARANLEQETRDRKLTISEAHAALRTAEAELATATARRDQVEIRSPVDGTVLDILRFAGEASDGQPLLRLGESRHMVAVAEVHETDARFVTIGSRATVTSPALPQPLDGTVESISQLVHKNDVLAVDPASDTDSRVIEVRILLDQPQIASRFVHLQVDVTVHLESSEGTTPDRREQ